MSAAGASAALIERDDEESREADHAVPPTDLVRIGLVALAVVVSWLYPWRPFAGVDVIALVTTLAGGYPIFREATGALLQRRMTMELSMTIALVAALVIGESFTALVIVLFVLIAEVLEHLTVGSRPARDQGPARFPAPTGDRPPRRYDSGHPAGGRRGGRRGYRETG